MTQEAAERRAITSVQELVEMFDLEDISFVEVHGTSEGEPVSEEDDGTVQFTLQYAHADEGDGALVRIGATARRDETLLSVTVVARYSFNEAIEPLESEILRQFVNEVAMYQVTPFLREGLLTTASRLRIPAPLLPILRATEIESISAVLDLSNED